MDETATTGQTAAAAPRTDTEKIILGIVREVLELDSLGIFDDFLDAGGHSLSATLCIARIKDTFGVDVTLDHFFFDPAHVAGLAAEIDRLRPSA